MLVFVDESGDAGFKLEKNSSSFFVVAAVLFDDRLEAERCAVKIKELRRTLGFADTFEFKFNKASKDIRLAFLQTVAEFKFVVRCIVVQKTVVRSPELQNKTESFYSYFAKSLLLYSQGKIINADVKIDGSGNRVFRREFQSYLRKQANVGQYKVVKSIKLVDSKQNVLIQLADMVAGATRRSYELQYPDSAMYREIIKDKYDDCWMFK